MYFYETPTSQQAGERGTEETGLTEAQARSLLEERGYHLVKRVQHLHASRGGQEWHVCLVSELASLTPEQFLQRFEEARRARSASLAHMSRSHVL
ncbi:MAG TPA: hypothetical protein VFV38_39000 [Ktedonobacteraceae bacterium]|nr:hypothetical protein [Ktedonobacteraceae bacterium]